MLPELEPLASAVRDADLLETLEAAAAGVLETMFFTEASASECEHSWLASGVCARVAFAGSHRGSMRLGISADAADSLASGFLGLDPQETGELERSQVILELANILCGAILSRIWPESRLLVDAPELASGENCEEGGLHRCFSLPEGMLAISIHWSESPEAA